MTTRTWLVAVSILAATAQTPTQTARPVIEVWKTATCGCCGKWVEHMQAAGFTPRVTNIENAELQKLKMKYGVPDAAASCHTARVNGYTIEGHVPASEVKRLLVEGRKVTGLAVPGMPLGSPGMEVSNMRPHPYDVLVIDERGNTKVFSTIKP